ncbi:MAG: L-idonate 5-dehydrogenase, partial [Acetobacteraceae bacterium]|nr:L-idonate 5-dehydrogenase [Acetobacteraceae bacterium]
MKAAVIHAPHDLRIDDMPAEECGADDVCVRVRAGGICG